MTTRFVYARPSDVVGADATVTVQSGTEDAEYPAANLVDAHPEKPAKLTTTTGAWQLAYAAPQRLDVVAVVHANLDAGLDVRVQGNASPSWASPTLDEALTIDDLYADGFPRNAWLDLATLFPAAGDRTFQYWRFVVSGANSLAVAVGELVVAETLRDLGARDVKWDEVRTPRRPAVVHQTDLLVRHTYDFGTTVRELEIQIDPDDATRLDVEELFRDAQGPTKPFLVVPRDDENDAWYVTLASTTNPYRRAAPDYNPMQLDFVEASRGLKP